jgi:hypothetical protein
LQAGGLGQNRESHIWLGSFTAHFSSMLYRN